MLIFVPIPLFSNPLSPFMTVSNILNYRLPRNWTLEAPKLAPTLPKMGEITILGRFGALGPNFGVTESKPRIENVLNYNK